MKSRFSKITTTLALLTVCGGLNSCRLFGDHKYSSQTEVETDVPESLEQGKPSSGPAAGAGSYAINNGVPPSSNLTEIPDSSMPAGDLPSFPGSSSSATSVPTGGASLTSVPSDSSRDLIDIPKPEFNNISVHNTRPPAEMLSLSSPLKPVTRMSLGNNAPDGGSTSGVVREKVAPVSASALGLSDADVAKAPKATKSSPPPANSAGFGVPLLLGGARLSDFYQSLHQPLLESAVVENKLPTGAAPADSSVSSAEALAVPPPPPGDDSIAPPPAE